MITEVKVFLDDISDYMTATKLKNIHLEFSNGQARSSSEFSDVEFKDDNDYPVNEQIRMFVAQQLNVAEYIVLVEGEDF